MQNPNEINEMDWAEWEQFIKDVTPIQHKDED